ncbi:MAG: D-alanyl-D-alanine carboxypeptidase/D-alanyl-D-alanine-endopeptidase [Phycisphaerae bacterium]|nr:D-alanyl-D-alanine carboxypeptidase/D-alanyl-D-alanine-endopeptidase [Phycisphaerae bacterium]
MYGCKRKILVLCLSVCYISGFCRADSITRIIQQAKQEKTVFAILAVDAQSGKTLYQKNADKPMIPASNMKLVTTAASLHYLGPDYVFQTKVGVLDNNLVIIGAGDPLLAEPKLDPQDPRSVNRIFEEIIAALRKADIKAVNDVVIDVSFFDNNRVHPSWPPEQLNQWYACEVSGLNFYNNCVHITAERVNNIPTLKMEPNNSYVTLINQLKLISKGSSAVGAYRNSVPNKLLVKGKLNTQAGFDVAIENPQSLFASILSDRLKQAGISIRGKILQKYVKHDNSIRILTTFQTPIRDVLARCNKDSLGLAAECLIKTISAENTQGHINGEWPHGRTLVSRYLQSLGVAPEQFVLDDGSGLSRKNQLSPTALVAVLRDVYTDDTGELLCNSLAVGGTDGTISKYFRQAPYKNNILGKTGYIAGVHSFSGICKTAQGDIIFSILTEGGNGTTRRCINDITVAVYDRTF